MIRKLVIASAVALVMLPGFASAQTIATVYAGFDPMFQDTFFTITNDSGSTETGLVLTTSLGPITSVNLDDHLGQSLDAGQSETYYFDQDNGGFLSGASQNGVPDDTTYQLSLTLSGQTLTSNLFSTAANSTGGYVDFLGTNCNGYACNDADDNPIALSGTVGQVSAVPEPSNLALMIAGVVGAFVALRRPVRTFA
jgi:hypothetical protein